MPYIITTRSPSASVRVAATQEPAVLVRSRRAVATLDEVRAAIDALVQAGSYPTLGRIGKLTEDGGTVTLPDGTVIEVSTTDWYALIQAALDADGVPPLVAENDQDRTEILDAYNAAQGG